VIEVLYVFALNSRQDDSADGLYYRAVRLACDDRRCRRAAVAAMAGVRIENNDHIFHMLHSAQGSFERRVQWYAQLAYFYACDFHYLRIKYSNANRY